MAVTELYSTRLNKSNGEFPDLYQYNNIPKKLRVQIIYIIEDAIGQDKSIAGPETNDIYNTIKNAYCREKGIEFFYRDFSKAKNQVLAHLRITQDMVEFLDMIELIFKYIDTTIRYYYADYCNIVNVGSTPDGAISELNVRFKENGVGYAFEGGQIIKIDSNYTHSEIIKPTIKLLTNEKYKGANDEYLKAHEHYRHGRNKECLTECLKAFESTMKVICIEKGWIFNQTDSAKKLIQTCLQNNLIPSYLQHQISLFQSLFESGIPTIRNRLGGHGQGQDIQTADDEITRYCLNLTGTNIIFLIELSGLK